MAISSFEDIVGIKNVTPIRGSSIPEERSFIENIMESWSRGTETVKSHMAIHEAVEQDDMLKIQSALHADNVRKQGYAINPVDGNIVEDLVYSSAQTASQMIESLKYAGFGATVGGLVGGTVGAAGGLLIPTVGEEPALIGSGAWAGAKVGAEVFGGTASSLASYREGRGGMYAEMISQGLSHEAAKKWSIYGAIPYAMIEQLQILEAIPGAKGLSDKIKNKATKSFVKTFLKKYGKKLTVEVGEEVLQEGVQIAAEDLAHILDGEGLDIDEEYIKERAGRLFETAKESAKAFSLVPIPASSIEASLAIQTSNMNKQMEAARLRAVKGEPFEVQAESFDNPVSKLNAALENSISAINLQEKVRKTERSERISEAAKARQESDPGTNWAAAMKSKLKGKYSEINIDPISDQISPATYLELDEQIRLSPENKTLKDLEALKLHEAFHKLYSEGKPMTNYEIKQAKKLWGEQISRQLRSVSEISKGKSRAVDLFALPKTVAASGDLSAILRQNALLIGNPKQWIKSAAANWKALTTDEKTLSLVEKDMLTSDVGQKAIESGIVWNSWKQGSDYASGTERFASETAKKVPFVQRSSRAYAFGLNTARLAMFEKISNQWDKSQYSPTSKDYKNLAHVVNVMTGEAPARTLKGYAPTLNALFFAPRLLEARIRSFTDILNPNLGGLFSKFSPRRILAWQMVKFIVINSSVLAMLSNIKGVEVERDPRSSNFGKVRIGNMRIDFWGGFLPLARTVTRLMTGETKTQSGNIIETETFDTIAGFLRSKLGPVPSAAVDFLVGENFIGEEVKFDPDGVSKQFYEKFVPFFMQDIVDALKLQGAVGGSIAAPLAFIGAGVSTYEMSPSARVRKYKDDLTRDIFGSNWDDLGSAMQDYMRESFPEIEQEEMKARFEYSQKASINANFIREQRLISKRIRKKLFPSVRQELDRLQMTQGLGVSRRIGDWRLPDDSFRKYEKEATKGYNKILGELVSKSQWKKVPDELKVEIISEILQDVKSGVRENIIAEANIKDFKKLVGGNQYGK